MVEPILITGAARSGTSLVAGIIHIVGGAFGGELSGPNRNNKKGMFENKTIRNELVKPHLIEIGCDPLGQYPLPDVEKMIKQWASIARQWRKQVYDVMLRQGYTEGPWFYKGAKMCLMWPLWHAAFPNAFWIIVRRDSKSIAQSCVNTGFMRAYRREGGWMKWIEEHEKRFMEMHAAGLDVHEVWPSKMIAGDLSEMRQVMKHLGLGWSDAEAKKFVSPDLWHFKGEANG